LPFARLKTIRTHMQRPTIAISLRVSSGDFVRGDLHAWRAFYDNASTAGAFVSMPCHLDPRSWTAPNPWLFCATRLC